MDEEQAEPRIRPPTPHPHIQEIFTAESESDIEPEDTHSEVSFTVHSQDEGSLSTDDTTHKTFHIPMTPPPRTLNGPLSGPSKMNTNNDNIAANTPQQPQQPPQGHQNPKPVRKTPLLPTTTVPAQQNRTRTFISGPPQCNNTRYQHNSTFPGPSQFQSNRFHQQHLPRPFHL